MTDTKKPEALAIADGLDARKPINCRCAARSSSECACDAVWPEHYMKPGAEQIRRLQAENEAQRTALDLIANTGMDAGQCRRIALDAMKEKP